MREAIVRPRLQVLSSAQKRRIHADALSILTNVGIRVASERARNLFQKYAGPSSVSDDVVRIPKDLIDNSLKAAPSFIDIYDRRSNPAMRLPGMARYGLGVTCLYYQDPVTDELLPFGRSEIQTAVRLGDTLASFDFISTPGILQNQSVSGIEDALTALEMIANTTKPLVVLVSESQMLSPVLDLLENLHGNLCEKPFVIPLVTPITPLVIDEGTCDRMYAAIARGLPFIYVNLGMAGVNTPITPYGSLVQLIAEILAGITFSQIIKEGTPVIAGSLGAFMDMQSMVNFYDPMSYLMNLACAEMLAYYEIPHYGTSGNAVGWGADIISAGHQWFNHLTTSVATTGMAAFVGTVMASKAFAPQVVVYADDVIAQARLFAGGFQIDESDILLDEVSSAGPGGTFLATDLTLENFRQAYFESQIFPKLTMEDWQRQGCTKAETYLRRYTTKLIASLTPPDNHDELIEKGEAFINMKP